MTHPDNMAVDSDGRTLPYSLRTPPRRPSRPRSDCGATTTRCPPAGVARCPQAGVTPTSGAGWSGLPSLPSTRRRC